MLFRSAVIAVFFFLSSSFASEFPSEWRAVTLRSPHFDVIVNAEQQDLGRFYAAKLEQALAQLRPTFSDIPERTIVVIADKTDLTNGYATRLPYPHIFIYPVLPGPQESLGETGDWPLEISSHELTHILTFEAASGIMEPLRSVFGTILSPNLLLPLWWKEGVAVHVETTVSSGGRLRSAYQDGVIRALEADGKLDSFDLPQINEMLPDWPQGLRPYLFGSIFWNEAVAEKGPGVIDRLHQRHGGRMPYFVEKPAREEWGDNYESMYLKALAETRRRARSQIEILSKTPPTSTRPIQLNVRTSYGPEISPNGRTLAVIAVDERARRSVRVIARSAESKTFVDGGEIESFTNLREEEVQPPVKDGPPTGSISRISWMPDGKKLVFDKVDAISRREVRSDLWVFDIETGTSERLSTGLRAREPSVARDGRIYFTGLEGGQTWLGRFDPSTKSAERLWTAPNRGRLAFPAELADGRVIFSVRKDNGTEGLLTISATGGEPSPVLADYPNARFPRVTAEGVFFTSTRNGVHNLFFTRDLKTARPASHSLAGVFTSTFDAQTGDVYSTVMTSRGPFVHRLEKAELARMSASPPPSVQPLFADRYPPRMIADSPTEISVEATDYSAGPYLWPRYWFPLFGLSAVNNSLIFNAQTSGFDPLKKHQYSLAASWDSGLQKAGYDVSYINGVTDHPITAHAGRSTSYLVSTSNPVITDTASISVLPDLFRLNRYTSASLGWQWLRTDFSNSAAERTGPSVIVQYADYGRTGEQISPEEGGSFLLGAIDYQPGENRLDYTQYLASGNFFWSRPLPKRHAIALRTAAAYTPDRIGAVYGVQTTNFFLQPDPAGLNFVMRGFSVGHFFGKSLLNAGAEYRFPLREIRRGHGTDPIYLTRLHGAFFVDAAKVDGFAYRPEDDSFRAVAFDKVFASFGAEARLETTIGYFLPLNFVAGFAVPSERELGGGPSLLLALQMGALF